MARDWQLTIRADGSGSIGLGHVVRCLSLARAVEQRGGTVSFVCRRYDGVAGELLRNRSFAVIELPDEIGRPRMPIVPSPSLDPQRAVSCSSITTGWDLSGGGRSERSSQLPSSMTSAGPDSERASSWS